MVAVVETGMSTAVWRKAAEEGQVESFPPSQTKAAADSVLFVAAAVADEKPQSWTAEAVVALAVQQQPAAA